MPGIPGIGTVAAVPANLPGLPSPAQGVPATPDILSQLITNAPSLTQGYETGLQIKEQRRKQAQEDLQILSQQAASNPTDQAIIKSLSKTARALVYDPKVFLSEDGKSVNTGALAQYNPYFQTAMQVIANPNADPAVQEYFAKLIGLHDFKSSGVSQKQYAVDVKNFWDQLDKFSAGTGDPGAVKAAGNTAYQEAMQRGDTMTANNIQQALSNPQLGVKTKAVVEQVGANIQRELQQVDLIKQQVRTQVLTQMKIQAQTGLLKAQTVEAAHKVGLIDAQTYATYQHVAIAEQNAATAQQRVQVALANVTTRNIDVAERAVADYNKTVSSLQSHYDSLTAQMAKMQGDLNWFGPDGKTLTPQAAVIQSQLTHLKQLQRQMPLMSPDVVTNAAAHNAGIPNTTKILDNTPKAGTGGGGSAASTVPQDLRGQHISRKQLVPIARKNRKSLQQVIKDYQARGAIIDQ